MVHTLVSYRNIQDSTLIQAASAALCSRPAVSLRAMVQAIARYTFPPKSPVPAMRNRIFFLRTRHLTQESELDTDVTTPYDDFFGFS